MGREGGRGRGRLTHCFAHEASVSRIRPWIYCVGLYSRDTRPGEKWIQCAKCVNSCHGECAAENNDWNHFTRFPLYTCLLFIIRFKTAKERRYFNREKNLPTCASPFLISNYSLERACARAECLEYD